MPIGSAGRRTFLAGAAGAAITIGLPLRLPAATSLIKRPFGRTVETLPVIGMGSWITFNVGSSARLRDARAQVLATFFDAGGTMIDSSPMYGSSEAVIGHGLRKTGTAPRAFSATKVWTPLSAACAMSYLSLCRRYGRLTPMR